MVPLLADKWRYGSCQLPITTQLILPQCLLEGGGDRRRDGQLSGRGGVLLLPRLQGLSEGLVLHQHAGLVLVRYHNSAWLLKPRLSIHLYGEFLGEGDLCHPALPQAVVLYAQDHGSGNGGQPRDSHYFYQLVIM